MSRGVGGREVLQRYLADGLAQIAEGLVGFPRQTLIVRDPTNPERWSVTTNEPDDVTDRLLAALTPPTPPACDGATLIATERARQIQDEGCTAEHDDGHDRGELIRAAQCYAWAAREMMLVPSERMPLYVVLEGGGGSRAWPVPSWPWNDEWWKPKADAVRNLVVAGALIAAEIDRLQRAERLGGAS